MMGDAANIPGLVAVLAIRNRKEILGRIWLDGNLSLANTHQLKAIKILQKLKPMPNWDY
jgi:hypothetical protein